MPDTRMTISQLETILGRAVKDPAFAKQLQADPETALTSMGYTAHPEEIAFFKTLAAGNFSSAAMDLNSKDSHHYSSEA